MTRDSASDYRSLEYWDRLLLRGPAAALDQARRVLAMSAAKGVGDVDARVLAHGAVCRACFEMGHVAESRAAGRAALAESARSERPDLQRAVSLSTAVVLAEGGLIDEGLEVLAELAASSEGVDLGRVQLQSALVLHHAGRLQEALEQLDLGERSFASDGEVRDRMRVHQNRGLVLLQLGRLEAAEDDLTAASAIAERAGMITSQAVAHANLGVLHGRARRLPRSIQCFARAASLYAEAGNPARNVAIMEIDRAEVLMHSGMVHDAVEAARAAVRMAEPTGNRVVLGDALLVLARALLTSGRLRDARRVAATAARTLESSGRHEMVAHSRSISAHAALGAIMLEEGRPLLESSATIVAELEAGGWQRQADDLRVARVRAGVRTGAHAAIADDLARLRLGAWSEQRDLALSGWYAEAVGRALGGDVEAALDACRFGLDLLDDIVAESGSLPERSAAMQLGADLSRLTIELAITQGDAATVLAAAEGTRGRALHEELAEHEPHRPLTVAGGEQLRRELSARLGGRTLVEWIVARDSVWAVVFDAEGGRLVQVGDLRSITQARDRLLVWLDLAATEPDASSRRAARASALLDELLIAPLDLPPGGVVSVPVGLLHGIPWSGLPSLAGRSVSLTPNAQLWLGADRRAASPIRSVGLVVGPGVGGGAIEHAAIGRHHPAAAVAALGGATGATVRSMFGGLDLVHVAAHGRFRSDRPLLSTLELDDGPATLSDVVPSRMRSRLVVLSSCEGGAHGTADGSEVLGLSAVMLARGAAAVLAPLTVVRDLECADFVADVHGELGHGRMIGDAVAAVRQRWLADDDLSRWAVASSFTCFGSGEPVLSAT